VTSLASATIRACYGLVLGLVLATRLLSPAGFMPSFEHGSLAIVSCPDFAPDGQAINHHHTQKAPSKDGSPCPYAAASGPALVTFLDLAIAALLLVGVWLAVDGSSFAILDRRRRRPPSRAPPLPA